MCACMCVFEGHTWCVRACVCLRGTLGVCVHACAGVSCNEVDLLRYST